MSHPSATDIGPVGRKRKSTPILDDRSGDRKRMRSVSDDRASSFPEEKIEADPVRVSSTVEVEREGVESGDVTGEPVDVREGDDVGVSTEAEANSREDELPDYIHTGVGNGSDDRPVTVQVGASDHRLFPPPPPPRVYLLSDDDRMLAEWVSRQGLAGSSFFFAF